MKLALFYYRYYIPIIATIIMLTIIFCLESHVDLIEINPDIAIETTKPEPIYIV